mmetsp:Transcript_87570/g.203684  ORF Transcript_87570/g.203684 Transcript_87570/m.203684 type:complete len:281 (-) Transcript_87570:55-897(-)
MNKIFNCCHGMFEAQAGHWICAAHASESGRVDEEIIGDDGATYKSHLAGDDLKLGGGRSGVRRGGPPMPVGGPGGAEDEKESAKQRLQRLIRDFAHDAVGPGLVVEAQCQVLNSLPSGSSGTLEAKLRMDRKLSRIELWSALAEGGPQGEQLLMKVALQQVKQITKRNSNEAGDVTEADGAAGGSRAEAALSDSSSRNPATSMTSSSTPRISASLIVSRRPTPKGSTPDLRLTFNSVSERDRAYTCLRIFQMSVDQSLEGQSRETESDATGYESSASPST